MPTTSDITLQLSSSADGSTTLLSPILQRVTYEGTLIEQIKQIRALNQLWKLFNVPKYLITYTLSTYLFKLGTSPETINWENSSFLRARSFSRTRVPILIETIGTWLCHGFPHTIFLHWGNPFVTRKILYRNALTSGQNKFTNNGAVPTSSSLQSYGSSDSCKSTLPPSINTAFTIGILVLKRAAFTANDTASKRFPPHSKIWKKNWTSVVDWWMIVSDASAGRKQNNRELWNWGQLWTLEHALLFEKCGPASSLLGLYSCWMSFYIAMW